MTASLQICFGERESGCYDVVMPAVFTGWYRVHGPTCGTQFWAVLGCEAHIDP
jgi:hypothetical protein